MNLIWPKRTKLDPCTMQHVFFLFLANKTFEPNLPKKNINQQNDIVRSERIVRSDFIYFTFAEHLVSGQDGTSIEADSDRNIDN